MPKFKTEQINQIEWRIAETKYDYPYCIFSAKFGDTGRLLLGLQVISVMTICEPRNLVIIRNEFESSNKVCIKPVYKMYHSDLQKSSNRFYDFWEGLEMGWKQAQPAPKPLTVTIVYSRSLNEYRVPGPGKSAREIEDRAYYTDDRSDAIHTAMAMYKGKEIVVQFRAKK